MYLPLYIAEEKNFFRKRDLDTKIVTFSRSNDLNALIGGDIQFDLTAPDKVIYGAPAVVLKMALRNHPRVESSAGGKSGDQVGCRFSAANRLRSRAFRGFHIPGYCFR